MFGNSYAFYCSSIISYSSVYPLRTKSQYSMLKWNKTEQNGTAVFLNCNNYPVTVVKPNYLFSLFAKTYKQGPEVWHSSIDCGLENISKTL